MNREFIKYNDRLCRIIKEECERSLIIDCMEKVEQGRKAARPLEVMNPRK